MPRFYCTAPLASGLALSLPPGAARHVQVLRLQPGDAITLFNGEGGEFEATVTRMGRSDVEVEVGAHHAIEREAHRSVHLLVGITANERMDWLVEKATEMGVASITPLVAERSVLKLKGERADKKRAHWQAVAVAACEQCGRNRVPPVHAPLVLAEIVRRFPWLRHVFADGGYAGDKLRHALRRIGKWTVKIVKRSDTAKGFVVLPRRWVVERTLAWLNRNRRLAKDFEQTLASATAWLFIASIQLFTRRIAKLGNYAR